MLTSPAFAGALAHQRLLRYLVEHGLAGREAQLKETVLGIEVFLRPAGSFDPRQDSIVRVEARRLRERLKRHYADAPPGTLTLVLPKGSYRVHFTPRAAAGPEGSAAELVERGQYFLRQGHEEGHRKALQRFEAAARLAPALAAAHGGVARAWLQLVATNLEPPRPGIEHALAAARRALALQPALPESLVLLAQLTHRFEFDWPAARALYAQALRVAPESAYVRHSHALSLMLRGDYAAAEAELVHARQLDPLHLGMRAHLALLHLYRRQWAPAEAALGALLDMSPDNVLAMSLLAYVELCRGNAAAALVRYAAVGRAHPQLSIGIAGEVQALAALGRAAEARARLAVLCESWAGRYLSPYQLAMAEMRLGATDAALAQLVRAVDERDPNALCLPVDPAFEALGDDPRFVALVQQVLGQGHGPGHGPGPGAAPGALSPSSPAAAAETSTP